MLNNSAQAAARLIRMGSPDQAFSAGGKALIDGDASEFAQRKYQLRLEQELRALRRQRRNSTLCLVIGAQLLAALMALAYYATGFVEVIAVILVPALIVLLPFVLSAFRLRRRVEICEARLQGVQVERYEPPMRRRRRWRERIKGMSRGGRKRLALLILVLGLTPCAAAFVACFLFNPFSLIMAVGLGCTLGVLAVVQFSSIWPPPLRGTEESAVPAGPERDTAKDPAFDGSYEK